jgi:hypothetical protein
VPVAPAVSVAFFYASGPALPRQSDVVDVSVLVQPPMFRFALPRQSDLVDFTVFEMRVEMESERKEWEW